MLTDMLLKIGLEYPTARTQTFAANPLAQFIRGEAAEEVRKALDEFKEALIYEGSAGVGPNFAAVPWVAVFDRIVTDTATKGYYVTYLFSADGETVHLSLNQGTTAVREEFKGNAPKVLRDRADLMRARVDDFLSDLPDVSIDLRSTNRLPRDYMAGHALGRTYIIKDLPSEDRLRSDLHYAVRAYLTLTDRGGLDPSLETESGDDRTGEAESVMQGRWRRLHSRIERDGGYYSKKVKRYHGTVCQACGFDFIVNYGKLLGEGFIEAHHLRPLSTLKEGERVAYNIATDFAVLCSNCHRMIHKMIDRTEGPWDIPSLQAHLRR